MFIDWQADSKTANAFQKELYALNPCDHKRTLNRQFSQRKHKRELLSQEAPYKFPVDKGESFLNVDLKGRDSSTTRYSEEKFSSCFLKKYVSFLLGSSISLKFHRWFFCYITLLLLLLSCLLPEAVTH